jgi:hypothetical protein
VTNDNQPQIEYSTLCGYVTEDDVTVRVVICRLMGADEGWALEVIDAEGTSTAWDDPFPTEQEAYREFYDTLHKEGIRSFLT